MNVWHNPNEPILKRYIWNKDHANEYHVPLYPEQSISLTIGPESPIGRDIVVAVYRPTGRRQYPGGEKYLMYEYEYRGVRII